MPTLHLPAALGFSQFLSPGSASNIQLVHPGKNLAPRLSCACLLSLYSCSNTISILGLSEFKNPLSLLMFSGSKPSPRSRASFKSLHCFVVFKLGYIGSSHLEPFESRGPRGQPPTWWSVRRNLLGKVLAQYKHSQSSLLLWTSHERLRVHSSLSSMYTRL